MLQQLPGRQREARGLSGPGLHRARAAAHLAPARASGILLLLPLCARQALRPILGTYEDIPAPDMNTGAREMVRRGGREGVPSDARNRAALPCAAAACGMGGGMPARPCPFSC